MSEIKEIEHIAFGILSHDEIVRQSVAEITKNKLSGTVNTSVNKNSYGTIYDPRMGPMESNETCVTCKLKTKDCAGHFGHIILNAKVVHPLYYRSLLNFLKCICIRCSKLLITDDHLALWSLTKLNGEQRFQALLEKMSKIRFCVHCNTFQPKYSLSTVENTFYVLYPKGNSDNALEKVRISTDHIYTNISKVSDKDIERMGFNPDFIRPVNLILTALPVLPPRSRPYIVSDAISDDDLTLNYCELIKINNILGSQQLPELKRQKYIDTLIFRIKALFDNSSGKAKHTNARPFKGFKERLSGKEGLIRSHLMGKRVDSSARSVIGPGATLRTDEIGVPDAICKMLTYAVNVNDLNIQSLQSMIWKGQVSMIDQKRPTGNRRVHVKFAMQNSDYQIRQQQCTIQVGDVVHRQIQTGDIALLNRQPTLHKGSMLAKRIIRMPSKTIQLNLATTSTFNADFDGDEMNLFFPQCETSRAELELLASTKNNMIGAQASSSLICIVQDALLSSFLMTSNNEPIERATFQQLLMRCDAPVNDFSWIDKKLKMAQQVYAKFGKEYPLYCGKTLFSLLLPEDLNYTVRNKAIETEPDVKIFKGILYEGAINKANLKSGNMTLICVLHKYYSNDIAMNFVNNVQFLANDYMQYYGFSIGIGDCLMDKDDANIDSIVEKCFLEAHEYSQTVKNERVKEARINLCLSKARDIGMRISKESLSSTNNFIKTVTSGSKGDYFNIAQIMGLLGQQNITGHRIEPQLNQGRRTLPHYPMKLSKEDEFRSKGFIQHSFLKGLTPQEFWFHAMSGREGITDTAMKTAHSGYAMRKMVKLSEDVRIAYDGTVRNSSGTIIQFAYGGDRLCGTKTVLKNSEPVFCDIERLADKLNTRFELDNKIV